MGCAGATACCATPHVHALAVQAERGGSGGVGDWMRRHPGAAALVAALAAGFAVTAVVQPVDVVTTRLWNQPGALYSWIPCM